MIKTKCRRPTGDIFLRLVTTAKGATMDSTNDEFLFEYLDPNEVAALVGEAPAERDRRERSRHPLRLQLTDELVRAAACGPKERWLLDSRCPGLALRISARSKSYYLITSYLRVWENAEEEDPRRQRRRRRRRGEGGPRRVFVGNSLDLTVDQARKKVEWLATGIYLEEPRRKLRRSTQTNAALTEYFQENRPEDSDWFKTVKRLFDRYIVPRYGDHRLSDIGRERWLILVQSVALDQPSRGVNLFKALKSFLSWAAKRGLVQANPLSKTKFEVPLLPAPPRPARLHFEDLVHICRAARRLGEPWSKMVPLLMLTGEPMEHIRQIEGRDIDWENRSWRVNRRAAPKWTVRLSPEAMALIEPYRDVEGFFFLSPRTKSGNTRFSLNQPMPINFYTEIIERLRTKTSIPWPWSLRDLRRAVRSEIDGLGEGEDAILLWSNRFTTALNYNVEDEVAL
jgi:integrase